MNRIIAHIEYLLVAHDCVIIPGVGAILAHTVGAYVDSVDGQLVPPRRVFTFNPSLDYNDGVIAASISRRDGISYEAAGRIVESAGESMKSELETNSRLSLGRVGTLLRGADGSLSFLTADCALLSPCTMWLPAVSLARFETSGEDSAGIQLREHSGERARTLLYRVARMAAAIALLIAVGFAISTPVAVNDYQQASLGIAPVVAEAPHRELIETPGRATAPVVLVLKHHSDAVTKVDTAAIARNREMAAAPMRYCLVVASLASEAETMRYLKESGDSSLNYFVKDGRYRVYAAQGATIEDVKTAAEASGVNARYSSSWICRK